jgi:hypothetical protein
MLDRIKTEPLEEINFDGNSQTPGVGKYNSEIYQLEPDFVDDDSMFEITPKRLNLDSQKPKSFFKIKDNKNQQNFDETQQTAKTVANYAGMK